MDLVHSDYWAAYEGEQSIDLNGCSPGRIAQTLAIEPGRQYTVAFSYAGNPVSDRGTKRFHVELDGQNIGGFSFDTSATDTTRMGWTRGQVGFASTEPSIELAFASDSQESSCYGPALDNVTVTPLSIP